MQVDPVGRPAQENVNALLKPFTGVTVKVVVAAVPPVTERVDGDAESVKLG